MLKIDNEKMMICLTRGDTANIVFSAVDEQGTTYIPAANDKLAFAVAKKVGADPLFSPIVNTYDGNPYTEVAIDSNTFDANKTKYWTESGGVYSQCTDESVYDVNATYYIKDFGSFWVITIEPAHTNPLKFGDYAFDVQLTRHDENGNEEVDTIIGVTDEISPTFRVWGEVSPEV